MEFFVAVLVILFLLGLAGNVLDKVQMSQSTKNAEDRVVKKFNKPLVDVKNKELTFTHHLEKYEKKLNTYREELLNIVMSKESLVTEYREAREERRNTIVTGGLLQSVFYGPIKISQQVISSVQERDGKAYFSYLTVNEDGLSTSNVEVSSQHYKGAMLCLSTLLENKEHFYNLVEGSKSNYVTSKERCSRERDLLLSDILSKATFQSLKEEGITPPFDHFLPNKELYLNYMNRDNVESNKAEVLLGTFFINPYNYRLKQVAREISLFLVEPSFTRIPECNDLYNAFVKEMENLFALMVKYYGEEFLVLFNELTHKELYVPKGYLESRSYTP